MTEALQTGPLPVGGLGRLSVGWWGVLSVIATEAALFAYLLFSYFYFAVQLPPGWNPDPHPSLVLSGIDTALLIVSALAVWWGENGVRNGRASQGVAGFGFAFVLGVAFLVVEYFDWRSKDFSLRSGPYGSLYFTIGGFHVAHLLAGVIALALIVIWTTLGYFDRVRNSPVLIVAAYWYFVVVAWLCVFFSFYISPYLAPS